MPAVAEALNQTGAPAILCNLKVVSRAPGRCGTARDGMPFCGRRGSGPGAQAFKKRPTREKKKKKRPLSVGVHHSGLFGGSRLRLLPRPATPIYFFLVLCLCNLNTATPPPAQDVSRVAKFCEAQCPNLTTIIYTNNCVDASTAIPPDTIGRLRVFFKKN